MDIAQVIRSEFDQADTLSCASNGDTGCIGGVGGVGYPGNSPNVTDVGGTDLTTAGPGGPWQSETAWIGWGTPDGQSMLNALSPTSAGTAPNFTLTASPISRHYSR